MNLKQIWSIVRGRQTNYRFLNASWTYYPNGDPMSRTELTGKPAGSMMVVCPLCNCESFRLLAPAPEGGKIGDRLPPSKWRITTAECIACGEQCHPFADYA